MSDNLVKFYGCYYHAGVVKQVIEYMNLGSLRNIINLVSQGKLVIEEQNLASIIKSVSFWNKQDSSRIVPHS